jgi:ribonuclease HI
MTKREMVFVVMNEDGSEVLAEKTASGGSNNIAELLAIREAMLWAKNRNITQLQIRTDSRNNFAWVAGRFGERLNDRDRVLEIYRDIIALREHVQDGAYLGRTGR